MEIDFNTNRVSKAEPSQPVARQEATTQADGASFPGSSSLENALKNLPAVRPEKVAQARALISDSQYPPDDVLDRIAVLLATKVQQ